MNYPKIIAEVGCNHKGNLNIAKEMIMVAGNWKIGSKNERCGDLEWGADP